MSEKQKTKKSFLKSFFKKMPWVFGFAILFMILSLKAVERFPQPLKEGVEGYFKSVSGQASSITELEKITFFPEIFIQMSGLVFSDSANVALINMTIESAKVHIPFLNMFTGGRRIYDFEIRNLDAKENVLTPHALIIDFLDTIASPNGEDTGVLVISGKYANQPLLVNVKLDRKKTLFGNIVYQVPKNAAVDLNVGEVHLKTAFVNDETGIWFRGGIISVNGAEKPIKDSALMKNKTAHTENIIACLLKHDYKNIDEICETYIKDENESGQL